MKDKSNLETPPFFDPWFEEDNNLFHKSNFVWDNKKKLSKNELIEIFGKKEEDLNHWIIVKPSSFLKNFKFQPTKAPVSTSSLDDVEKVKEQFLKFSRDLQDYKNTQKSRKVKEREVTQKKYVNNFDSFSRESPVRFKTLPKNFDQKLDKYSKDLDKRLRQLETKDQFFLLYRGRANQRAGNFEKAIHYFDGVIKLNPHNEDALVGKGVSNYNLVRYADSIIDLSEVIKLNPKNKDALLYRGLSKYERNNFSDAIKDFDDVIELDQSNYLSLYWRGLANFYLTHYEESISDLTKVIEKSKFTYEAFLYRGCANFYLKEFEQSIVDFSKSGEGEFEEYWKRIAEKLLVDKSCFDYYKNHELPRDINEGFEVMKYKTLIH